MSSPSLQALLMEVDHRLRGHQALGHHNARRTSAPAARPDMDWALFSMELPKRISSLILRQTAVRHRLPVGGDALLGRGQPGQAADDADALVALCPPDGRRCGRWAGNWTRTPTGTALTSKVRSTSTTGNPAGISDVEAAEILHGAGDEQTVHQSGGQQADIGLLPLWDSPWYWQ